MDEESFEGKIFSYIRENKLIAALVGVGVISLGVGIFQFQNHKSEAITFQKGSDVAGISTASAQINNSLYIDISGEVMHPGVYKLVPDARVQDALTAAGGLTEQADRGYVSKYLNLAQKISDGGKIYIPKVGDVAPASQGSQTVGSLNTVASNGKININTASADALDSLPGIGPVTANKIISGRPYTDTTELTSKKIVSSKIYEKIKDQLSLY